MTIKTTATGDGSKKDFTIGFPYLDKSHLRVFVNGVKKTEGTDYSIYPAESSSTKGGALNKIHFGTAPTNGHTVKIVRNTPFGSLKGTLEIGHTDALQTLYKLQELGGKSAEAFRGYCNETDTLAGTAQTFEAPCDGYIDSLLTEVKKAVTTGGDVTVEVDGVAVTGLSTTIANSAIVGTTATDTPTTPNSSTTKFFAGSIITVTPAAAFATAGAFGYSVGLTPADL